MSEVSSLTASSNNLINSCMYDAERAAHELPPEQLAYIVAQCSKDMLHICKLLQSADTMSLNSGAHGVMRERTAEIKTRVLRLQQRSRVILQRESARTRPTSCLCHADPCIVTPVGSMHVSEAEFMRIRMELAELQRWKMDMEERL